jgi:hypothetical protein
MAGNQHGGDGAKKGGTTHEVGNNSPRSIMAWSVVISHHSHFTSRAVAHGEPHFTTSFVSRQTKAMVDDRPDE